MSLTCPSCGRANEEDARFCAGCGAALASGDAEGAAAAPGRPVEVGPDPPAGAAPGPAHGAEEPPGGGAEPPRRVMIVLIVVALAVAAAAAWWAFGRGFGDDGAPTPKPAASASSTPTTSPGAAATGYLAAVVGRRADTVGAVAADGTVHKLATGLGPRIFHIAYSQDGRRIAVVAGTYKLRQLSIVDLQNGDTVTHVHITTPAVVGVDSVAWLSPSDLLVSAYSATPKGQGENGDLLVYHPADGSVLPLTDSTGAQLHGIEVSAAHDGSRVVFVAYTGQKVDQFGNHVALEHLDILDRFSSDVTELEANEANLAVDPFDAPLISPNGQAVIFRRAGFDTGTTYSVISATGVTLMSDMTSLFRSGYAWDPMGTRVVFTAMPSTRHGLMAPVSFYVFDMAKSGPPKAIATYRRTLVQDLAWSPDGSTIAWAKWDANGSPSGALYLMPASGGASRRLTAPAIMPAWAPGAKAATPAPGATVTPAAGPSP